MLETLSLIELLCWDERVHLKARWLNITVRHMASVFSTFHFGALFSPGQLFKGTIEAIQSALAMMQTNQNSELLQDLQSAGFLLVGPPWTEKTRSLHVGSSEMLYRCMWSSPWGAWIFIDFWLRKVEDFANPKGSIGSMAGIFPCIYIYIFGWLFMIINK